MGKPDYQDLRDRMVSSQLIWRGIRDERVLEAMRTVPRHRFVPDDLLYRAYDDCALPIGNGQTISQPYMVAVMTELLELKGTEKVLEIGTGSGYQAAILSILAAEVYTMERHAALASRAEQTLRDTGYKNVHVFTGDGTLGLPDKAPFDGIIVTAGSPKVPEPLRDQLADGGILVAPIGSQFSQELIILRRKGKRFHETYGTPCVFVPLIGEYGWSD